MPEMKNKWIVLVGDPDSEAWTVAVNSSFETPARKEYADLKEDGTPAILIYTGDYVTV